MATYANTLGLHIRSPRRRNGRLAEVMYCAGRGTIGLRRSGLAQLRGECVGATARSCLVASIRRRFDHWWAHIGQDAGRRGGARSGKLWWGSARERHACHESFWGPARGPTSSEGKSGARSVVRACLSTGLVEGRNRTVCTPVAELRSQSMISSWAEHGLRGTLRVKR